MDDKQQDILGKSAGLTVGVARNDDFSIAVVTASTRIAQDGTYRPLERDTPDALLHNDFDAMRAPEKARALPRKMWVIVASGMLAWALVAMLIPLIFD